MRVCVRLCLRRHARVHAVVRPACMQMCGLRMCVQVCRSVRPCMCVLVPWHRGLGGDSGIAWVRWQEGKAFKLLVSGELPEGWADVLPTFTPEDKGLATRLHSQTMLNALETSLPGLALLPLPSPSTASAIQHRLPSPSPWAQQC